MLIDLYELLQEEDGLKKFNLTFEEEKFKTRRNSYPVEKSNVYLEFHNDGKKHISLKCTGDVTLVIPCNRCLEPVSYDINIDTFKDLDLNKTSQQRIDDLDETKESPLPKEEETFMPFNFGASKTTESNNTIEEIKPVSKDTIIDPMDSVIKLDPNYNQMLEEEKGLDLKTAINEIRNLVSKMEQTGFNLNLEEIDLQDSYQMTINIKKNDN